MRSNRTTKLIAALLALALAAIVPAAAGANPLLSGYGGPGEGDQAILGAALLNGPSEGGGSSGGSSGSAPTSLEAPSAVSVSPSTASARHSTHHAKKAHDKTSQQGASSAAPAAAGTGRVKALADASSAGGSGGTLGLSGGDFLYILLALVGLAMTALLTGMLVRGPHQDGGQLKG
jgi:hypothetical protein